MFLGAIIWESHIVSNILNKLETKLGTKIYKIITFLLYFGENLIFFVNCIFYVKALIPQSKQALLLATVVGHNVFVLGKTKKTLIYLLRSLTFVQLDYSL